MKKSAQAWYQTRPAFAGWSVLALLLGYVFASLAIDSGSLLQYFIAIVLLILSIRFLIRAIWVKKPKG